MLETSARLLRLLSLLQTARDWTGPQLAQRLGVTTRTVRADVGRLRTLGYPVHATPGTAGGYRLGAGAALPPLLLDDDEAVAVAISLRTGPAGSALAKLEQVLPSRLRHRVATLAAAVTPMPATGVPVPADTLTVLAAACRDRQRLRFDYRAHDGTTGRRDTEPYRLVHTGRRWYLIAYDVGRAGWRTFRVDRLTPRIPAGPGFTPRDLPGGDAAAFLARGLATATWQYRARVVVAAPADRIAARLPDAAAVEPLGPDRCAVTVGSDDPATLAAHLGLLGADFQIDPDADPELAAALIRLADRFRAAVPTR